MWFKNGIRKYIFKSEIEIVQKPFFIIRMAGNRHCPFGQDGIELNQNITWNRLHRIFR